MNRGMVSNNESSSFYNDRERLGINHRGKARGSHGSSINEEIESFVYAHSAVNKSESIVYILYR